jgi:hypothetical protein
MKELAVTAAMVASLAIAGIAYAQTGSETAEPRQPASGASVPSVGPTAAPSQQTGNETDETQGDPSSKPWGRLAIFIPISVLLGAGTVVARRALHARGWIET